MHNYRIVINVKSDAGINIEIQRRGFFLWWPVELHTTTEKSFRLDYDIAFSRMKQYAEFRK